MSMEVGTQRVMPTASGPAISFDSGGRRPPVLKLRSSFLAPTPDTAKRGASECKHAGIISLPCHPFALQVCAGLVILKSLKTRF